MADKVMMIVTGGGGGAPRIPPRQVGKPGIVEVASQCSGPEYNYLKGFKDQSVLAAGHNPKQSKSKKIIAESMREVFNSPPSTLGTNQTPAERRKQQVAIGLSKARARGAKV